ncbi:MAG: CHAT domain-containing protein [Leptolyngbyaceae cyanobacterium]
MPTIRICEQQCLAANQFAATVQFDSGGSYPVTITNPFDERDEARLEWYFEGWLRRPFLNTVTAAQVKNSIPTYGEALFEQVFQDRQAYAAYANLRPQLNTVEIVVESASPDFQALHWEALKDPDLPRPLALDCTMVRRPQQAITLAAQPNPSSTINLLVVTARPNEEKDVNYRTISRPLIEAIQQAKIPINVELLRPGTYQALENHLQAKGSGYYHIVHFDAHGGLATFEQITREQQEADTLLFKNRYGRNDIAPYAGTKAFLFLEGEIPGQSDPVEAQELAHLLTNQGIPVCILNACQSAKQVRKGDGDTEVTAGSPPVPLDQAGAAGGGIDNRETSLGSRLMTAGMQMVVAMGYSVSVTAATILMAKLYTELFAQKPLAEAIRLGRRELHNSKTRKGWFNLTVDLEDWLLPVVYGNPSLQFDLQSMSPQDEETYLESLASRYRFPKPTYGFFGRDLEILKIEKSLLRHNALLLRGMGGTGKTTLLNYLREWWQTTQFAQDVFYFGYDDKAYTLEQILQAIAKQVYDRFALASFQAMSLAAQAMKLATLLKSEPYALMLDNLESVTGQELAIQNTLPEAEQVKLKDFLLKLVGGQTKVVLGSRSGEDWLAAVYRDNRYALQGLDPQSRTELAEQILERHVDNREQIAALRAADDFGRLMTLLAGYPLAMEVVLANLGRQSPGGILAALDAADINLDSGSENKTQSILKCVEYSHSNLSPEAQKLLLCLAPFKGFIDRADLENYAKQLKQLEPFQDYPFDKFDAAVQEAINWGLLSSMSEEMPRLLTIQPVFPYFLKTKLAELDEVTCDALSIGFKNHYQGLAGQYQQLMQSKKPQERQLGLFFTQLEYENLYGALEFLLRSFDQSPLAIGNCLNSYLELTQDKSRQRQLAERVSLELEHYPPELQAQEVVTTRLSFLDQLALSFYHEKDFQRAKELYELLLKEWEQLESSSSSNIRNVIGGTYHQLGSVAQEQRQYEQAQQYYQQALAIKIEFDDRYEQASTYFQLGMVAEETGDVDNATAYYLEDLRITVEFNDEQGLGISLRNLARFYQATQNADLLTAAAQILNTTPDNLTQLFEQN